jgi:hypothetical protein
MNRPFDLHVFEERNKHLGETKFTQEELLQWAIDMNSMIIEHKTLPNGEKATERQIQVAVRALNILEIDMKLLKEQV